MQAQDGCRSCVLTLSLRDVAAQRGVGAKLVYVCLPVCLYLQVITYEKSLRTAQYAFEFALLNNRKKVHRQQSCLDKQGLHSRCG